MIELLDQFPTVKTWLAVAMAVSLAVSAVANAALAALKAMGKGDSTAARAFSRVLALGQDVHSFLDTGNKT